jgi:hypothetical protein
MDSGMPAQPAMSNGKKAKQREAGIFTAASVAQGLELAACAI